EVLDLRLLADIHERASEQAHREHVTAYVWDNQASFDIVPVQAPDAIADQDIRLDLDTATDYLKLRDLVRHAPSDITEWSAADIVKTYKRQLQ
ncbi:MAG: hypothetical protein ABEI52_05900, partial [Halobacteriaceae archaeon]